MQRMKTVITLLSLLLLLSCGNIPVPKKSANSAPQRSAKPAEDSVAVVPMNKATVATTTVAKPEAKPKTKPESPPVDSVSISVEEHVDKGIDLLQNGEVAQAKSELYAALRRDPGNVTAVNLVHQINTSAEVYFAGENYFLYETHDGDTFSSVAGKFLNDPLKFYILAKFNGVSNPAALTEGRKIKIPGEKSKEPAVVTPEPAQSQQPNEKQIQYDLAKNYYDSGKYQIAIDILERFSNDNSKGTPFRDLLVLSYTKYADVLAKKADLLEAQTVLEKALSMQPRNAQLQKQMEALGVRQEADNQYQRGVEALQAGDKDKAYEYFRKALELQPDHALARKQIFHIKSQIVDAYYKKAMQYYSKQQLLEAVKYWDRVLELDPNHEMAKLYRARALELQQRLNNL